MATVPVNKQHITETTLKSNKWGLDECGALEKMSKTNKQGGGSNHSVLNSRSLTNMRANRENATVETYELD